MAWRKRGGRRWGWERSVAMVAALPFPSTELLPQREDSEAAGLCKEHRVPPCPGRGGGGRVGGGSGQGFTTSEAYPFLPRPAGSWEELSRRLEAGGPSGRVRPHPALPRRPWSVLWGGPVLPSRRRQGQPGLHHITGMPSWARDRGGPPCVSRGSHPDFPECTRHPGWRPGHRVGARESHLPSRQPTARPALPHR